MLDQINDVGWGNNAKVSSVYYRYTILEKKKRFTRVSISNIFIILNIMNYVS